MLELILNFAAIDLVTVTLTNRSPITIPFTSPFTKTDWEDIQRYLEKYPVQYGFDLDDRWAAGMVKELKLKGQKLFQAVFADRSAERLFNEFQDAEGDGRQITIAASQPEILRLPWELLCDPNGAYLVHEQPRIAIRRQLAGAGGGRKPVEVKPKAQLRLLMVVSRPIEKGVSFIDPRAEAQAVLQAIEQTAPGRVVVEFLRPATLTKLVERLENRKLPAIDIVHFDGHGTFVANGEAGIGKHDDGLSKGSQPQGMGYLVFEDEDEDGKKQLISAEELGDALHRQQVSLMVLSACQSAMVTGNDALGCVAARLTHGGIPAVLAMTYSVLVTATEQLFGKFYRELAGGQPLGVALANARRDLYRRKRRGLRWRGTEQIELELADWFLPAWYQAGGDITLLKKVKTLPQIELPKDNLREVTEEGFFGRSRELWQIERAFVQGTRRMTITGFGGQGKTYLAVEAGRWLSQTGMFDTVCFVDYAAFQGVDAVSAAVSEIGCVLEQSLIDAAAVTKALSQRRTLIILDNLESLAAEALQELLMVAKEWSQVGATRLLLTTRDGGLSHTDYPAVNSLSGLGDERHPEDAIRYFQGLMKLPPVPKWDLPERAALIELFKMVQFHPLSIKLVAYQLKERRVGDLARSLEQLLAAEPKDNKDRCLIASLNLSLERLPADLLELLPRLGVFQGGALEFQILDVLQFAPEQWQKLKAALLLTGLVQVVIAGVNPLFIRFHPTLAPVLWGRLTAAEQGELRQRHQKKYYDLVIYLCHQDSQYPATVRISAKLELANLLWAVNRALDDQDENAVNFVICVNKFLDDFGLKRDRAFLTKRLDLVVGIVGSKSWCLVCSSQGEQLYNAGQYQAAADLFFEILQELDPKPSFDRAKTLGLCGRCLESLGELPAAAQSLDDALKLSEQLESSDVVKQLRGTIYTELGIVFGQLGKYDQAQQTYEDSLAIYKELNDREGVAVVEGQLGSLAILQNDLATALERYHSALATFQQIQDLTKEAVAWQQLGTVYQECQDWAAADQAYRESARISEQQENITGAAATYGQLAILNERMQDLSQAEHWYRKALKIARKIGDQLSESKRLLNLADLLTKQSNRLPEANQLAIAALAIKESLDPAATEIWKTYGLLAKITTAQDEADKAKEYRYLARTAKAAFAGTQYELRQHAPLIELVVAALEDAAVREQFEPVLVQGVEFGRGQLVAAIRRVLDGERNREMLWDDLDLDDSMIIAAILQKIVNDQP